jgi:hypothetical protein
MKSKALRRTSDGLSRRERDLWSRYLAGIPEDTLWDFDALDAVISYVALLHSEAEFALEELVKLVLDNARSSSERWRPHPVLVNAVTFFQSEVASKLGGLHLCPKRSDLERDTNQLIDAWDRLGAKDFFEGRIKSNHGIDRRYVESLYHPVGFVITRATFKAVRGRGVTPVGALSSKNQTELTEFVSLRGLAVHSGRKDSWARIRTQTPSLIRRSGMATVDLIDALARGLQRNVW